MTPEQKLKWAILAKDAEWDKDKLIPPYPCPNVDDLYDQLVESDMHWDAVAEIRAGGIETKLKCETSRHYESRSMAMQMPDGSWVGWTYWYGGGKHGEPGLIDWMQSAYDVTCQEKQELVTVQTFNRT